MAKGISSGYAPLGGVLVAPRVADRFFTDPADGLAPMFRHGLTYSGHATACVVAEANLDVIEEEGLIERSAYLEIVLDKAVAPLREHPLVEEVRSGASFMAGIHLRADVAGDADRRGLHRRRRADPHHPRQHPADLSAIRGDRGRGHPDRRHHHRRPGRLPGLTSPLDNLDPTTLNPTRTDLEGPPMTRIGLIKETKPAERRVALTEAGVATLVADGHDVLVETGAGDGAGISDLDYERAGAKLVATDDAWAGDLVVKVKEPIPAEYGHLRQASTLFTYLHLAADRPLTEALLTLR